MCKYQYRKSNINDICIITDIADHFFESKYWDNDKKGRCQYFKNLYKANNNIFYVLEFVDESQNEPKTEIVGYNSIIPETRTALQSHTDGTLNQYSLNSNLIYRTDINIPTNTLYWQAIAIYSDHLRQSKEIRDLMIAEHIAKLLTKCNSKDFNFIAEKFSEGGERFMKNRGFLPTNITTATNHKLWTFSSNSQFIFATEFYPKGRKLVERVNELRKNLNQ